MLCVFNHHSHTHSAPSLLTPAGCVPAAFALALTFLATDFGETFILASAACVVVDAGDDS